MVHFREVQRLWFWLIFLLPVAIPLLAIANAVHTAFGDRLAHKNVLYVAVGSVGLLAVWFFLAKLVTEVRETALSIRRNDPMERDSPGRGGYSPMEYHGWGVRWGPDGRAFSVIGNRGVRIQLASGGNLLEGSQRAYELPRQLRSGSARAATRPATILNSWLSGSRYSSPASWISFFPKSV